MAKTVTLELPDGIADIEVTDMGVGPFLLVTMDDGKTRVALDGLHLTAHDYGVSIQVAETREEYDGGDGKWLASVNFDATQAPEILAPGR